MRVVLGNDAAWGGWAWCLATPDGPVEVGHVALTGRWRLADLRAYLDDELARALTEGELLLGPADPPVRVVVERPPELYRHGNQSAALGVGRLVGALQLWGLQPGRLAYPDEVEPEEWRSRWGIRPAGKNRTREVLKNEAMLKVRATYGNRWLDPYPLGAPEVPRGRRRSSFSTAPPTAPPAKFPTAGPRGDVAEAILLSVDAARRYDDGPTGPASWRAKKTTR